MPDLINAESILRLRILPNRLIYLLPGKYIFKGGMCPVAEHFPSCCNTRLVPCRTIYCMYMCVMLKVTCLQFVEQFVRFIQEINERPTSAAQPQEIMRQGLKGCTHATLSGPVCVYLLTRGMGHLPYPTSGGGYISFGQFRLTQARLNSVKLGQVFIRLREDRLSYVRLCPVSLAWVLLDKVGLGWVRSALVW